MDIVAFGSSNLLIPIAYAEQAKSITTNESKSPNYRHYSGLLPFLFVTNAINNGQEWGRPSFYSETFEGAWNFLFYYLPSILSTIQ